MKAEIMKKISKAVMHEIGKEHEVNFSEVTKNNGSTRQAIVIRKEGSTVLPNIYINELLNQIENNCMSIHDAAVKIADIYRNANAEPFSGIVNKLNKDNILKNVVYQLVNTEKNTGLLCNMPHKKLFDLSAIYKVIVKEDSEGTYSIAVRHEFCNAYGINEEELELAARKNTKEKGFCVFSIAEVMADMIGVPLDKFQSEYPPMFILTNAAKNNGAAVMLYDEYFRELAQKLKSDLYIMPSSIHEVIAVPIAGFDPNSLRKLVAEVNKKEVDTEEILGESVYKYNLEAGRMEMA